MKNNYQDVGFSSKNDEWATPSSLFIKLNNEFNFTLDACATQENNKCKKYFTKNDNGLFQSWENERVFCNPPYSNIDLWVQKCYEESVRSQIIVMLIPVRTDTKYFHKYIYKKADIRFIKGRVKFVYKKCKNAAPFPSMIVVYKNYVKLDEQVTLEL
jgi:phage N-6-adenine-methyltransferase